MASKIIVDQLESSGSNITIPTGTGLVVTDGIAATNLSGTIADARLPTVPVAKGGTGLTSLGSAGQAIKVNSGGNALEFGTVAGGKVLQVKQTTKTDSFSTSSTSMVDITGFSVSITPSATTSKILVMAQIGILANNSGNGSIVNLLRDSTNIISNTAGGSTDSNNGWNCAGGGGMSQNDRKYQSSPSIQYLDTPSSTSSLTYKCQVCVNGGSTTAHVNHWPLNADHAAVSTLTVMEISA